MVKNHESEVSLMANKAVIMKVSEAEVMTALRRFVVDSAIRGRSLPIFAVTAAPRLCFSQQT
jgi:hypothetical protein